jgi:TorA maturation chaperone TorD
MSPQCSQTFELLSQIFLFGLTEENVSKLGDARDLGGFLPEPFDEDEAAADHQHLFGFNVFPFESVFLDPSGRFGGDLTASVSQFYRQAGYEYAPAVDSPDHLGSELAFLAFLCRQDENAGADALPAQTQLAKDAIRLFLDQHLMRWLPPLVVAIRQQGQPFYDALVAHMLTTLQTCIVDLNKLPDTKFNVPQPPPLLEEEGTSLADIADFLLAPVYSGVYLSRDFIGRLASRHSLPSGFGQRRPMLTGLIRSAVNYGHLDEILASLQEMASAWESSYREMSSPPLSLTAAAMWADRAAETVIILSRIRSQARAQE